MWLIGGNGGTGSKGLCWFGAMSGVFCGGTVGEVIVGGVNVVCDEMGEVVVLREYAAILVGSMAVDSSLI